MNDRFRAIFGVSFAGALLLIAGNGKAFFEALAGFPALVSAWSSVLPAGTWSAMLALVVATGAWSFSQRFLPPRANGRAPDFASHTIALLIAVAITIAQVTYGTPGKSTAGEILQAMWMGVAAGFGAPYLGMGLSAVLAMRPRKDPLA